MTKDAVRRLRQMISQGDEAERKLSAGVFRSIVSDMITLYEENRKYRGKGLLVFAPFTIISLTTSFFLNKVLQLITRYARNQD